ncbi:MAG: histidine kinase [Treponema sp.]|nr:histidine kinase [Treponema sp.]
MADSNFSKLSLRLKIMGCVTAVSLMVVISLFGFMVMNRLSINTMGNAFTSNTNLNTFQKNLTDLEYNFEVYNEYRTYESIDSYYASREKVENYRRNMQKKPSLNPLRQKEYIVQNLTKSFVYYSGVAVAEKRANKENTLNYEKSLRCYRILQKAITELNTLLLENNAEKYMNTKSRIQRMTEMSILFFTVYFLLILAFLYMIVTEILHPLREISRVAERVADRDFDIPLFESEGNDEIAKITRAFDRMIVSIKQYINTIWEKARTETELRQKEIEMQALYSSAQLKAFQSQINPHFLFNTLNTGAQLAMMEGADKTCSFIEQTSDFFRYNLRQQKPVASVMDELGMVDNYVYIMKVRYGQRLEFIKEIPDKNFEEVLPVMTLQPLVENCIKHGLQNEDTGRVTLTVGENPAYIIISISDNGEGMDDATREEILNAKSSHKVSVATDGNKNTGIGLINVYSRLRLYFQRDDVFDIMKNDSGTGTRFIVRIPKNV